MPTNSYTIYTDLDLAGIKRGFRTLVKLLKQKDKEIELLSKKSLRRSAASSKQALTDMNKLSNASQKKFGPGGKPAADTKKFTSSLRGAKGALEDVGRRVFVWGSLSAAIFGVVVVLKKAIEFTKELDTSMAELRKVISPLESFDILKGKAFEFGIEFGVDPNNAVRIIRRFAQAGLETADALSAARSAMLAMNVTGADLEQSINALIGANRIFNISFEDSARIIDKIQAVQANFAVDSKDLIASITAIGPAITLLGGDIDDLFGMIAALGEAARISGKEASNSLKRVFARITTREGISALQEIGIAVHATEDSFRSIRDIFGELGAKWKSLTDVEKKNLAVTLAQVRQYPKFIALIENFNRAQEATKLSVAAFGDAQKANNITMNTYAKQLAVAEAQIKQLGNTLIERGIVSQFTDFKSVLGDIAEVLNAGLGGGKFITFVIQAATGVLLLTAALKASRFLILGQNVAVAQAFSGMSSLTLITTKVSKVTGKLGKEVSGTAKEFIKGSKFGLARFASLLGVIGVALIVAAPLIRLFFDQFKDSPVIKETVKSIEEFKDALSNLTVSGISKFDTTSKFIAINNELQSILKEVAGGETITKELLSTLSEIINGVSIGDATSKEIGNLTSTLTKFKNLYLNIFTLPVTAVFEEGIRDVNKEFSKMFNQFKEGIPQTKILLSFVRRFAHTSLGNRDFLSFGAKFTAEIKEVASVIDIAINKIIELEDASAKLRSKGDEKELKIVDAEIKKNIEDAATSLLSFANFQDIISKAAKESGKAINLAGLEFGNYSRQVDIANRIQQEFINQAIETIKNNKELAASLGIEGFKALEVVLTGLVGTLQEAKDKQSAFLTTINSAALRSASKKTITGITEGFQAQIGVINQLAKAADGLGSVFDTFAAKSKAASDTIQKLVRSTQDNADKLLKLQREKAILERALQAKDNLVFRGENIGIFADILKTVKTDIGKTSAEIVFQVAINKQNTAALNEQLPILLEIERQYKAASEQVKRQTASLEDAKKASVALLQDTIDLNKNLSINPFKGFASTLKLLDQIVVAREKEVRFLVSEGKITAAIGKTKRQEIQNEIKLLKAAEARALVADALQDSLEGAIAAQETLLDIQQRVTVSAVDAALEISKIGKARGRDDFLTDELKAINKITSAELNTLGIKVRHNLLTAQQAKGELFLIELTNLESKQHAIINDLLEKKQDRLRKVRQEVDGIKGAIAAWLSDQTQIFDDLQSRGGFFKFISRGVESITSVIAAADAQIIAESLTGNVESLVSKIRGGIKQGLTAAEIEIGLKIKALIDQSTLPLRIQNAIKESQDFIKQGTIAGVGAAWDSVLDQFPAIISGAVKDGFAAAFRDQETLLIVEDPNLKDIPETLSVQFLEKFLLDQLRAINDSREAQKDTTKETKDVATAVRTQTTFLETGVTGFAKKQFPNTGFADIVTADQAAQKKEERAQRLVELNKIVKASLPTPDSSDGGISDEILFKGLNESIQASSRSFVFTNTIESAKVQSLLSELTVLNAAMLDEAQKNEGNTADNVKLNKEALKALGRIGVNLASNFIGGAIAEGRGKQSNRVAGGQSIGFLAGTALGGPLGGTIGSIIGGALGGLFGSDKEEPALSALIKIEKNTANLVDLLSPDIFNAPANFALPVGTGQGGGVTITNSFVISGNGTNNEEIIKTLSNQIDDVYQRSPRRRSVLR